MKLLDDPQGKYPDLKVHPKNGIYYFSFWSLKLGRMVQKSLKTTERNVALKERSKKLESLGDERPGVQKSYKRMSGVFAEFKRVRVFKPSKRKCSGARFVCHNQIDRHLNPFFGDYSPSAITSDLFNKFIAEKRAAQPNWSGYNACKYMTAVMNWAHSKGLIKQKISFENPDGERADVGQEIDPVEFERLLQYLSPTYRDIALLSWDMGFRVMEAKGLTWNPKIHADPSVQAGLVDFKTNQILFEKKDTKNRKARSPVMTKRVRHILERRRAQTKGSPWVFPSPQDPAERISVGDGQWQDAKKKAGVSFRFHDIRHTTATRLFKATNRYAEICEFLGMDLEEALDTYVRFDIKDMAQIALASETSTFTGENWGELK